MFLKRGENRSFFFFFKFFMYAVIACMFFVVYLFLFPHMHWCALLSVSRKTHTFQSRSSASFCNFWVRSLSDGDQGTASKDLVQVPIGPVTRARAKKFKDVLNGLIQELWAQANLWRPIEHDPRGQQKIVTLIQVLEGSGQG